MKPSMTAREIAKHLRGMLATEDEMTEVIDAALADARYRAREPYLDVARWAQATLTALNVGDVAKESPLHLKLREVMIAYRAKTTDENGNPTV